MAVGLFMLSHLRVDTPIPVLWAWMFVTGLGVGPTFAVFTLIVQNSVPVERLGTATSNLTFFQQVGGTVGLALTGTIFATSLSDELPRQLGSAGVPPAVGGALANSGGLDSLTGVGDLGAAILAAIPDAAREGVRPFVPAIVDAIHAALSIAISNTFAIGDRGQHRGRRARPVPARGAGAGDRAGAGLGRPARRVAADAVGDLNRRWGRGVRMAPRPARGRSGATLPSPSRDTALVERCPKNAASAGGSHAVLMIERQRTAHDAVSARPNDPSHPRRSPPFGPDRDRRGLRPDGHDRLRLARRDDLCRGRIDVDPAQRQPECRVRSANGGREQQPIRHQWWLDHHPSTGQWRHWFVIRWLLSGVSRANGRAHVSTGSS